MAINTSATSPTNATTAVYTLLTTLTAAGWIVKRWSDATTDSGVVTVTSNPFGSAASGAGNLGNSSAWFRIQSGDATREWVFQRGAADTTWTVIRGKSGFTTGGNATTLPTDSTSYTLLSAAQSFNATPGRWLISANTVTYAWYCTAIASGGGNVFSLGFDEPMASGTYPTTPVADADPYLAAWFFNTTGYGALGGIGTWFVNGVLVCYKRFRHGLSGASNVRCSSLQYFVSNAGQMTPPGVTSSEVLADAYNTQEWPLPVGVTAPGTAVGQALGWCGFCDGLRLSTMLTRSNGQTFNASSGAAYYMYVGGLWFPWDSSTPTI
jgi:hypothetical protein